MMGYDRGYDAYGNMMSGAWFGGLLMLLFGALVLTGIVLLVVWIVKTSSGHGPSAGTPPETAGHHEAVALAKRRLASGEITTEQYNEIMRALGG